MRFGFGFGFQRLRNERLSVAPDAPEITATVLPVLASPLYVNQALDGKFTAGTYTSTGGDIESQDVTYLVNGVAVPSTTVLAEGDQVQVQELVTDSGANSRPFYTTMVVAQLPVGWLLDADNVILGMPPAYERIVLNSSNVIVGGL